MNDSATCTVAHAVMALVREYDVDTVFGIPGTHNIELYRSLRTLGFHIVTTRHEQGAAFAAGGWSLTSGRPGVVITTSGPGLLNALSAAATSWAESRPMLVLSPGTPRGTESVRVGALHETKNPVLAAASVLAWSRRVETEAEAIQAIHEAFRFFSSARPGPVHIELPLDLLTERSSGSVEIAQGALIPELPPADEVRRASRILARARRPAILAGGGSLGSRDAVQALAERVGAPVVTTVNGKGALDERHPLVVGSDIRLTAVQRLLSDADVLLVIGSDLGLAELWEGTITPAGTVIRIDIDPLQIDTGIASTVALVGDAAAIVPALVHGLGNDEPPAAPWVDTAALRRECFAHVRSSQPTLARIVEEVLAVLPEDAIIAGDSSQVTYLATSTLLRSVQPNQLLYMPTYATLGYGLPAAIGAKIAAPSRTVVGILGDGALMFSVQEFVTAVEQRLCLPIVCVDNGGYGEIRQNMVDAGVEPVAVDLVQPDWAALGRALGGAGVSVEIASVGDAVRQALRLDLPSLIHIRVPDSGSEQLAPTPAAQG